MAAAEVAKLVLVARASEGPCGERRGGGGLWSSLSAWRSRAVDTLADAARRYFALDVTLAVSRGFVVFTERSVATRCSGATLLTCIKAFWRGVVRPLAFAARNE